MRLGLSRNSENQLIIDILLDEVEIKIVNGKVEFYKEYTAGENIKAAPKCPQCMEVLKTIELHGKVVCANCKFILSSCCGEPQ